MAFFNLKMKGTGFSSPATELSQRDTVTRRYMTTLLGTGGDRGQRPQALRHHESDLISLELVPLRFVSNFAFPEVAAFRQKRQPGSYLESVSHAASHFWGPEGASPGAAPSLSCHCPR